MRIFRAVTGLVLLSLCVVACDPGIFLSPFGIKQSGELEWTTEKDGVRFTVRSLGGLIGSQGAVPELTVENRTPARLVVDDARLETKGRTYGWRLPGDGAEEWRSADAGATGRISLVFQFNEPISKIFGDTVDLVVNYRVGPKQDVLRVTFKRES